LSPLTKKRGNLARGRRRRTHAVNGSGRWITLATRHVFFYRPSITGVISVIMLLRST
jgi:hypothetical protein